jgi:sigma-B regulation protein RsbU (phosphoserine phosphatase)
MPTKILVVDDEPDLELLIRQKFRPQVRNKELEFVFAQNGAEALAKLKEDAAIELVLSDINMPEMDGLTLLTKMSELSFSTKAVIVSAYGDMKNIRTAMNRGAFDFVIKPIDFEDLEITIKKTLHEIAAIKQAVEARDQLVAIHQELSIASNIQQSILPRQFPPFPEKTALDIFAEMIPAKEVGGDFYDFFLIDDDRLGFVIGDVSGKGVPASIFMAVSHTLIRAIALTGVSPAECLQQVNVTLSRENVRSMFVTIFYAVLNLRTGELEYCNGGHNPPFYLAKNGQIEFLQKVGGLALGVMDKAKYEAKKLALQSGDGLFLYTDGITEAMDAVNNEFSEKRLQDFLKQSHAASPAEMIRGAVEAVRACAAGAPQADDITALAIKYQPR